MIKINGQVFGGETFKNNEAIYKAVDLLFFDKNNVDMYFEDNRDITNLIMAIGYLRSKIPNGAIELYMPYIPYSRMDREINDQIFSLELFANVINSLGFTKVKVLDPHSIVSENLINNLVIMPLEHVIEDIIKKLNVDVIMFPDKGARKKYTERYKNICSEHPVIYAEKVRDLENKGRILCSKIVGDEDIDLTGKNVLIIDDICVYGNTFKFASMALKEKGVNQVSLWVTHCENVIVDGPLFTEGHIDHVYTTNSIIRHFKDDHVTTVEIGGSIDD